MARMTGVRGVPAMSGARSNGRLAPLLLTLALVLGCQPAATTAPSAPAGSASGSTEPTSAPSPVSGQSGSVVVLGRVMTMADPPIAEALFIENGIVAGIGRKADVLAMAGPDMPVIEIGAGVAYPGFIDAHAHWVGDREVYGVPRAADAVQAALERGWTSISEQWVNEQRLGELTSLAGENGLPLRVDAYLALNEPNDGQHFGDWYADRTPGPVGEHLRVRGLKITLDNGWGTIFNGWDPATLAAAIGRADDAGWQVAVHTVSTEAHEMVLDAFEAAIGPTGPNPLHHRIDHAIQVSDEHLARIVAMDLAAVVHLDGASSDWVLEADYLGHLGPDNPREPVAWLARWRDFVEAGLHVAGASDAPWVFPNVALIDDIGRPVDQIAGGMDGRGRANPETPAWVLDQLLTAEQGLRAVTLDAAYVLGDEARRGHLAPGALGDVTILSGDVTTATPDEIRAMTVLATIVGGVPAYCPKQELCASPLP